ncbi:hypothetical protein [Agromyces sp. M3QZ16-3]|uniref:hypothetical protein n=1 Tax=Agromyces sp. M3QZ16-3 TaxID=3447585 RepID=UPI003F6924E8
MKSPSPLPPALAGRPFSVHRAVALGVSRGRLPARDLEIPFRAVRAPVGTDSLAELCRAYAERMPPGHVFSHATAALLWGLPLPSGRARPLHVAAPAPQRQPRMRDVVGHRLGAGIPTTEHHGFPLVAPVDAWCQLAASLGRDDLVAAGDRLVGWRRPLAKPEELRAAVVRYGSRRGAIRLREALADLRAGSASRRESLLRLRVLRAGFPEPELNAPIRLGSGWTTHGDLVFRAQQVLLEYDGEQHRVDAKQFHRDVERLNDLAADGWIVIRIGRLLPPPRALEQLERALRSRGWSRTRRP